MSKRYCIVDKQGDLYLKLSGCGLQDNNHSLFFIKTEPVFFLELKGPPTKSMLLSSKITKKYLMSPSLQLLQKSLISDLIAKGQSCPTSSGTVQQLYENFLTFELQYS